MAQFFPDSVVIGSSSVSTASPDVVQEDDLNFVDLEDAVSDEDERTDEITDPSGGQAQQTTNATITHVVDGDTFDADLDGVGEVRIRMLGVNTPETVDPRKAVECFGKTASDYSKQTLAVGSRVLLEEDSQADERDKYGRLLRNVILADGTDYNAKLVEEGYAYAYLGFPLDPQRKTQLKRLENEAKSANRGLWGAQCD
jgi:micrococcal nuclease